MPEFYALYQNDPDYLGTLTQMDIAIGVLRHEIDVRGMSNNTVVFYMITVAMCVWGDGGWSSRGCGEWEVGFGIVDHKGYCHHGTSTHHCGDLRDHRGI